MCTVNFQRVTRNEIESQEGERDEMNKRPTIHRGYWEKNADGARVRGTFFSRSVILNITFQGRLEVPIVPFIRIRPETAVDPPLSPPARNTKWEWLAAAMFSRLFVTPLPGGSGFSERESRGDDDITTCDLLEARFRRFELITLTLRPRALGSAIDIKSVSAARAKQSSLCFNRCQQLPASTLENR